MTESQPAKEFTRPGRRRGMLAFYIAMGVVAALFMAGYFAWTPLRVWYFERELLRPRPVQEDNRDVLAWTFEARQAAKGLVAQGPWARLAVARALKSSDPVVVDAVWEELCDQLATWSLETVARKIRRSDDPEECLALARRAKRITGHAESFPQMERRRGKAREVFLAWWEREGKTKYGRSE